MPCDSTGDSRQSRAADLSADGLFTDLYELVMAQSYLRENLRGTAVFELFFRHLPEHYNYLIVAGLDDVLERLERLAFTRDDMAYLRSQPQFSADLLDRLAAMRFTGDVDAVREGTAIFPDEPILRVTAPLPEAQWVETLIICLMHFPSLAATSAARNVTAAAGRRVVDFGSRRAHGRDAAMAVARSSFLAGFAGTSLVDAGRVYGIPIFGTMAHSYVQTHDDQMAAFAAFAEGNPGATLLVDTYDTIGGVERVIELSRRQNEAFNVRAIRLDSGDLGELSRISRRMLDEAGLERVQIFASGNLDEYQLERLVSDGVPIDGFGVGTSLAVSEHAPAIDIVYKLAEYDGQPRMKLSSKKATWPGSKQIFRREADGCCVGDTLAPAELEVEGRPLLEPVMRGGRRLDSSRRSLDEVRRFALAQLDRLPAPLRQLSTTDTPYQVAIHRKLRERRDQLQRRLEQRRL